MDKKEYLKSVEMLNKWARAYYTNDKSLVSDEEYDALYHRVLKFEEQNPNLALDYSPTKRVGDKLKSGFKKIKHIDQMWSMQDIFNTDELDEWLKKFKNDKDISFFCEPKFDGASLNLTYDNGILISAATRGDGKVGEDVTNNAKAISSIPLQIDYKEFIEIRGEVVISKDDFKELNEIRQKKGESLLSNPRNAASGSLRQLDPNIVANRRLKFYPWGVGKNSLRFKSHFEQMNFIRDLGFLRDDFCKIAKNKDEIVAYFNELSLKRDLKEILMDGMVVRVDEVEKESFYGYTIKFPKFMVAFKFAPIKNISRLIDVEFSVGRSGAITPVAKIEPINIDGVVVKNVTLHNFDEIKRLDLKIFDYVNVIRSGDVIPKITEVIISKRDKSVVKDIKLLEFCPVCNSKLFLENAILKCENIDCPSRILNQIIYFASKKCLNIVGLGKEIIKTLIDNKKISKIIDLFFLKKEDFLGLEGFKDKKISNILKSIDKSKNVSLARFITSLGIDNVGEVASIKIAEFGKDWYKLSYDELIKIDGVGEELAKSFRNFIDINKDEILKLENILNINYKKDLKIKSNISDKTFVITGTLSKSRDEMKKYLISLGANVSSSISKKTNYLLCGENGGSKLQKAKDLGIKIISEDELQNLL